jgi:uridine kinase
MGNTIRVSINGSFKGNYKSGLSITQLLDSGKGMGVPLVALVNGKPEELANVMREDCDIVPLNISDPFGARVYARSLIFVLVRAVSELFPGCRVTIEHSLGKGLYGELYHNKELCQQDIDDIKKRMREIIESDAIIEKHTFSKAEAAKIFAAQGMIGKLRLLNYLTEDRVYLYKCGDIYDYFYGYMLPSAGYLKLFDLILYSPGFILRYPNQESPLEIQEFKPLPKLSKVFREAEEWAKILDVVDIGSLNEKVDNGDIKDFILVAEALHEKKIANIADRIYENKDRIKIVLIAGPSSSGKTTFSKRLSVQLRVLGLRPQPISLDDYFLERDKTPLTKEGKYDFENVNALDLDLFNSHLTQLLEGEEVEFPVFNFVTGKRESSGKRFKMDKNSVLVIEGIHGLNELLTSSIPRENKYKIYISALTQLNIDDHNRIPTTDVRVLRRIVRDNMSRGRDAETTLLSWPMVREGEEKYIFPFQEDADIMFNSTLDYEMCVLKAHADKLINSIGKDSQVYVEAKRLKIFLSYFRTASDELVPHNSIIREFIGGSYFFDN